MHVANPNTTALLCAPNKGFGRMVFGEKKSFGSIFLSQRIADRVSQNLEIIPTNLSTN